MIPGLGHESTAANPIVASTRPSVVLSNRVRHVAIGTTLLAVTGLGIAFGPTALQVARERNPVVAIPRQVAGLTTDASDTARDTSEYLRTVVAARISLKKT